MNRPSLVLAAVLAGSLTTLVAVRVLAQPANPSGDHPLKLGNFSVSLAVKDLAASRTFYEKLGFRVIGAPAKRMVIMQNDSCTIGLYQGMFEKNTLTFNPGWDRNAAAIADFDDVRELQKVLKERGLTPTVSADDSGSGPAFFTLTDPDGNPVLVDQHVPKPKK